MKEPHARKARSDHRGDDTPSAAEDGTERGNALREHPPDPERQQAERGEPDVAQRRTTIDILERSETEAEESESEEHPANRPVNGAPMISATIRERSGRRR